MGAGDSLEAHLPATEISSFLGLPTAGLEIPGHLGMEPWEEKVWEKKQPHQDIMP